jgi:protein-disulfide isomerase
MQAKIQLFSSPTCPHCPHAKKAIMNVLKKRDDAKLIELSTATQVGRKKANLYGVRGVPTLFVSGPGHEERIGYVGVPSTDGLNKMINISLGKEKWEEKKSLFQKLKNIKIKF